MLSLKTLDLPWKLLLTCFLLVLTSGFIVSELYLMHTTEMADGQPGMSLDDISYTFYGNKTKTTLRKQILGPMKKYFSATQDQNLLTPQEQIDLEQVLVWNDQGAPESLYWDLAQKEKDKNPRAIVNLLFNHGCLDCHAPDATMKGNKKTSPLDTYEHISKFTRPDTGMDKGRLLMLSHVHLLGMGMMFLLSGAALAASSWPAWFRSLVIVGGLSSVPLDIFGWWGVKYGGPAFSPLVMLSGILMAVCFGASVIAVLFDVWKRKSVGNIEPSGK